MRPRYLSTGAAVAVLVGAAIIAGCGGDSTASTQPTTARAASAARACADAHATKRSTITIYNHMRVPVRVTATIPNCTSWGSPNPTNYDTTVPALTAAGPGKLAMPVRDALQATWTQRFTFSVGADSTGATEYRSFPVLMKVKPNYCCDADGSHYRVIEPDPRPKVCMTCELHTNVPIPAMGTFAGGTLIVGPRAWTMNLYP